MNAWQTVERLGVPEGELALAQAVTYLACAAKSNAVYTAFNQIQSDVRSAPSYEVPKHLRNAPTELMKQEGYGENYRYSHDEANGYSAGESYFPEELAGKRYYQPVNRGLEIKIGDKLAWLKSLDEAATQQRYKKT